jgi:hypothetical protein
MARPLLIPDAQNATIEDLNQVSRLGSNEEKLLERLDQAILDVIDNPQNTQKTTAIGTLF